MTSKRLYFVLIAALVLLGIAIGATAYAANELLVAQAAKISEQKAASQVADNAQLSLIKNKKDIQKYSGLNAIAQTIVPQDKDQAEAVREISNLAASSGIAQLSSITFPASTLGATPTIGLKTVPSTSVSGGNGLTQVTPVLGITGVYDQQITVSQDTQHRVSYSKFVTFLTKLQQNRRTAQVSSINVQPKQDDPSQIAFTLVIDEYIKP